MKLYKAIEHNTDCTLTQNFTFTSALTTKKTSLESFVENTQFVNKNTSKGRRKELNT